MSVVTLKTDCKISMDATKFRGFIASKFPEQILLHQHEGKGFVYLYPRVQYKVIDGMAMIVGIEEGVDVLQKIAPEIDCLNLGDERYEVIDKRIQEENAKFGVNSVIRKYRFLTPWLALNEKNYERYRLSNKKSQKELLEKIMIGNLLSMAKGLEYVVTEEIKVILDVSPTNERVRLKKVEMAAFTGSFVTNFTIPDYFGLGKSISRGFGTIVRQNE